VESTALDPIDRAILGGLRENGRVTWRTLGDAVGLSPTATAERVRRLEEAGVITGYQATVDPGALGRNLEAFVAVKMHAGVEREPFEEFVSGHDAVVDVVHLTGPDDYLVHTWTKSPGELDELLTAVKREKGVADTSTRVVLRRIAST
jgi:Lrp/AsnC family transcriptional regulator, leucine-responsive regulatory protein